MNEIKEWLKRPIVVGITVGVVALIIIIVISKCNSDRQQQNEVNNAVLQTENSQLSDANLALQQQLHAHKWIEDSLTEALKEKDKQLVKLDKKLAVMASNYATELNRVQELNDEDAVGLFLDNSDCGELPILRYKKDNDSGYIIPICPIRTYNDMKVGYDMLGDNNRLLQAKIVIYKGQVDDLTGIATQRGERIIILDSINKNHEEIETNLNKQIKNEKDNYKREKRRTALVGISGAILIVGALLIP